MEPLTWKGLGENFVAMSVAAPYMLHTQVGPAILNHYTRNRDSDNYEVSRTYKGHRHKAVTLAPIRNWRESWHNASIPRKIDYMSLASGTAVGTALTAAFYAGLAYAGWKYFGYPEGLAPLTLPLLTNGRAAWQQHKVNKRTAKTHEEIQARDPGFRGRIETRKNEDGTVSMNEIYPDGDPPRPKWLVHGYWPGSKSDSE